MSDQKKDPLAEMRQRFNAVADQLELIGGHGKISINLPTGGTIECDTAEEFAAIMPMMAGFPKIASESANAHQTSENKPKTKSSVVSFLQVMEEAFADAKSGWTPRTEKSYRQKCNTFAAFLQNPPANATVCR